VRFVGDPVAIIMAETRMQAQDAAEMIEVKYDILSSVTDTAAAMDANAPVIWAERGSNLCVHWSNGREARAEAAFARAAKTVSVELVNNRLVGNPMEPRVALGEYDPAENHYTLHSPTQGVVRVRESLARFIFKLPKEHVRVVSPDVGGGFGLRGKLFPESAMVLWAAKRIGRPVKWRADRTETFLCDPHGRDHVTQAEMAFDASGKILGMKVNTLAAMGAYLFDFGPRIPTVAGGRIQGTVYDMQDVSIQVRCVFTNTVPTDAYRGAGRPETAYVIERLLDQGALAFGLTPDEIRNRNYVKPEQIPYVNCAGNEIDSGRFEETQNQALALMDWKGFSERRATSQRTGKLRGRGIGYFIEASGGQPQEWARVRITAAGEALVHVGTFSHGQGHETAFAQVLHARLGIPFEKVRLIQGDSDLTPAGGGTGGSRSSQMGGVAVARASELVLAKARRLAAHLLEVAEGDIEHEGEIFRIAGTDRTITWAQLATAEGIPDEAPGLDEELLYKRNTECNFPNGCHVAEVEIDPDTGTVSVVRYAAVDDVGVPLNPLLVHGQCHGGIVSGIGQALYEHARYDDESGQFLTATFQDYCLPRAADLPDLAVGLNVVPCPSNDLGVKGAGEGGSCGAPPAVVSAVCDALGVAHIDMPVTPEKVWRALAMRRAAE
jgi:aerobic carbon-monoxide dehydrogenase large subunit